MWNQYGAANYLESGEESRCRCSDPDPGEAKLSSQLVEDPGYDTYSLAGPHKCAEPEPEREPEPEPEPSP